MKGNQLEDRKIEEWARLILDDAMALVELLGEAENGRHLLSDNPKSGILVDQWTQPPLFNTEDIATMIAVWHCEQKYNHWSRV
jgi:hypothetical protein